MGLETLKGLSNSNNKEWDGEYFYSSDQGLRFNSSSPSGKILQPEPLDHSYKGLFKYVDFSGKVLDLSDWDMSKITDVESMFEGVTAEQIIGLETWDTSNVKTMKDMFKGSRIKVLSSMSNWNVSNVVNMQGIFHAMLTECKLDLSGWDTSNVENMSMMFCSTRIKSFGDITKWNIESVKDFTACFHQCMFSTKKIIKAWSEKDNTVFNEYVRDELSSM